MPSHYWYCCEQCNYRAFRYRNVKRCPDCKGNLVREEAEQEGAKTPAVQQEPAGHAGSVAVGLAEAAR